MSNPIKEINGNYKIVQVISSGYVIRDKYQKILIKSNEHFNIDDLVNIQTVNIEDVSLKKEKYNNYLRSLNIRYLATNSNLFKVNKKSSVRSKIINYFLVGPEFYVKYISLILIGKKNDLNQDLYEKVKHISVLHLFVISGFHINLLMTIILFCLKKFKFKKILRNMIGFTLVFLYLYILNFSLSSLRSFLFLFFCFVNKEFLKSKFQKIDVLSFIMLIIFSMNPYVVFSLSFIFTFSITFSILFVSDIKNKKIKVPLIILFAYLSSVILSIYING
jgi:competence protein ComEC